MRDALSLLLTLYLFVLLGRAVLSWFPIRSGTFLASLNSVLWSLTEPILSRVRKVVPPAGMFDVSFIVVVFGIIILQRIIAG